MDQTTDESGASRLAPQAPRHATIISQQSEGGKRAGFWKRSKARRRAFLFGQGRGAAEGWRGLWSKRGWVWESLAPPRCRSRQETLY